MPKLPRAFLSKRHSYKLFRAPCILSQIIVGFERDDKNTGVYTCVLALFLSDYLCSHRTGSAILVSFDHDQASTRTLRMLFQQQF